MIKTIASVSRKVAQKLSLNEDLVKKVNSFYWKSVKESISSGEHTSIHIKHLGTLTSSRYKLNNRIKQIIKQIRYLKTNQKDLKVPEKVEELKSLLRRRSELAKAYQQNEIRRTNKKSLGQQTSNTPRSN